MLYTMVVLTYCAGLRIGELVRLTLADVHLDDDSIEIRESKFFKYAAPLAMSALCLATANLRSGNKNRSA
jgi:integrase/recombinase XerD